MQNTITSLAIYKSLLVNETQPDNPSSRFLHVARQFLANTPALKTRETYARELCFFIFWYDQKGSIANIGFEDLLRYKVMVEGRFALTTVAKKIAALKSFFRFAKRTGVIINNPAEELRAAGPTKDRIPAHLTIEEVQRLIKMPDRRTTLGKRDAAVLTLLPNTGMRRSEIISLKMDSFIYHTEKHKQKTKVYIKILGKGNKERMMMVHEEILPYLEDWIKVRPETDHGSFFTTK